MSFRRCLTIISKINVAVAFFILWASLLSQPGLAAPLELPEIVGEAGIVVSVDSGDVLGFKNPDLKLPMASTTKIMTALLTLEQGRLTDTVTISEEAAFQEGSSMYTSPNESYSVEEMLYGLMLNSGNDAAWALGEYVSGNVTDFVSLMNKRAQELGASNTHFINPNGLPDEDHYSTARDLAMITRAAMLREDFCQLVATKAQTVPWPVKDSDKLLVNHNKLLWRYDGANGVKTGYTNQAGQCLVASAERDGQCLIAVVLKSQANVLWTDAERLLDWGFDNFTTTTLVHAGDDLGAVTVERGMIENVKAVTSQDFKVTVPKDDVDKIQTKIEGLPAQLAAPVDKGQVLGKAVFLVGDKEVGQVALVAGSGAARAPVKWKIWLVLSLAAAWFVLKVLAWDVQRRRSRMRLRRIALRYRDQR